MFFFTHVTHIRNVHNERYTYGIVSENYYLCKHTVLTSVLSWFQKLTIRMVVKISAEDILKMFLIFSF